MRNADPIAYLGDINGSTDYWCVECYQDHSPPVQAQFAPVSADAVNLLRCCACCSGQLVRPWTLTQLPWHRLPPLALRRAYMDSAHRGAVRDFLSNRALRVGDARYVPRMDASWLTCGACGRCACPPPQRCACTACHDHVAAITGMHGRVWPASCLVHQRGCPGPDEGWQHGQTVICHACAQLYRLPVVCAHCGSTEVTADDYCHGCDSMVCERCMRDGPAMTPLGHHAPEAHRGGG